MNCPHCEKRFEVPQKVFQNVESYGSNSFHVACKKCGGTVWVGGSRTVKVELIGKGDPDKVEMW